MEDKEKQIEQMARCMANCENTCDECFEQLENVTTKKIKDREQHCHVYTFAKRAVEQGYRKILKDSVVLSREGYDILLRISSELETSQKSISLLTRELNDYKQRYESSEKRYEQLVQSSCEALEKKGKETAEKILNEQYQECKVAEKEVLIARGGNKNDDYYKGFALGMTNTKMHIQELAKQFGAEVEE